MTAESVTPEGFRAAIGAFPTGVAVVTSTSPAGPVGLTTNAVSSLSLDPVMLVVRFDNSSRTLPVVRESGRFAVNLLRADQEPLARVFASKEAPADKFAQVSHSSDHGIPILDDVVAWFACEVTALHPGGDHTIALGTVTALGHEVGAEPLRFERGGYR